MNSPTLKSLDSKSIGGTVEASNVDDEFAVVELEVLFDRRRGRM